MILDLEGDGVLVWGDSCGTVAGWRHCWGKHDRAGSPICDQRRGSGISYVRACKAVPGIKTRKQHVRSSKSQQKHIDLIPHERTYPIIFVWHGSSQPASTYIFATTMRTYIRLGHGLGAWRFRSETKFKIGWEYFYWKTWVWLQIQDQILIILSSTHGHACTWKHYLAKYNHISVL